MKRITALLLLLLLLPVAPASMAQAPLAIIATNFSAYDFTRQIAGERADVTLLLPPGADSHSFEPSPRDLIALSQADLLVYNGGVGEHWVHTVLESLGADAPPAIRMMDAVEVVAEEIVEGMEEEEHTEGEPEEEMDEHVWTSPRNAARISQAIAGELIRLDPEGEADYRAHLAAYRTELTALNADFQAIIQGAKRKTIVLGDRFPMRYFTKEYGLSYYAAFPGCSSQTEPSARTLAFLMDKVLEKNIPVVFHIEFSNRKAAEAIAAQTGAKSLLLHSAHNVTQDELDAGVTYITIMRANLAALAEALN